MVPYPELRPIVEKIYSNHPLKTSLNVKFLVMTVDMVKKYKMDQDYDVLVGRNFTVQALKKLYPNKAILGIPITGYDIIRAIYEARETYHAKKIGIIGKFFDAYGYENLEGISNCKLVIYPVDEDHPLDICVATAKKDQCDCIIGGYSIHAYQDDKNIHTVVIKVGKETIYKVFDEAIHIAQAIQKEREKAELFRTITQSSDSGIFYINVKKEIEVANQEARRYYPMIGKADLHQPIVQIAPYMTNAIDECFEKGVEISNKLYHIQNTTISALYTPVRVQNDITGIVISFQDVTKIHLLESQIRKQMSERGLNAKYTFNHIIYKSSLLRKTIENAKRYAKVSSNVLILGETGTGKELFAQSIHNASPRRHNAFVAVNCAALPENLLESELFGYVDGAFTGSKKGGKIGLFELAHQGTIFLDEISEIPFNFQSKLLRVLQEKEVRRIGSSTVTPIDVRIIAATNKSLKQLVANGKFRQDLIYRLDVLELYVPPLRARKEDISLLFSHYLIQYCNTLEIEVPLLSTEAENLLCNYDFVGNVRELRNLTERLSVLNHSNLITKEYMSSILYQEDIDIFNFTSDLDVSVPSDSLTDDDEKQLIMQILSKVKNNRTKAAKKLGIDRTTLWRKMKKYQLL